MTDDVGGPNLSEEDFLHLIALIAEQAGYKLIYCPYCAHLKAFQDDDLDGVYRCISCDTNEFEARRWG